MTFDSVICINLDRRPDRWIEFQAFAERAGIRAERYPAVDGLDVPIADARPLMEHRKKAPRFALGQIALSRTQRAVLAALRERGPGPHLVLEDDAELPADFAGRLATAERELPADWELLHLGPIHKRDPIPYSEHWTRPRRVDVTHAYVVRGDAVMADLIECWSAEHDTLDRLWDPVMNARGFCARPYMIAQRPGYSDLVGRRVDYFPPTRRFR